MCGRIGDLLALQIGKTCAHLVLAQCFNVAAHLQPQQLAILTLVKLAVSQELSQALGQLPPVACRFIVFCDYKRKRAHHVCHHPHINQHVNLEKHIILMMHYKEAGDFSMHCGAVLQSIYALHERWRLA